MSFFSRIFKSSSKYLSDVFAILHTDLHSHLIPGIDDGAATMNDSLTLIAQLKSLGFSKLIITPHIMSDYYRNTPDIILSGFEKVKQEVKNRNIEIDLQVAAEYYYDFEFRQKIGHEQFLTFGKNYLLVEFPMFNKPDNIEQAIFDLQIQNYTVILAHPERYLYWATQLHHFEALKERGVLFQMNILSLLGHYNNEVQKLAEKMIKANMIDFLGTDTHNMHHINILTQKTLHNKWIQTLIENGKLLNNTL